MQHLLARCLLALAPILLIVFTVVLQSLVLCLRRDLNLQVNVWYTFARFQI